MHKGFLTDEHVKEQSKRAYAQWCVQWREHAKIHSRFPMKSLSDFEFSGVGKAALCVANGYSLELEIETIKKYHKNIDTVCCDKSLGSLIRNGVKPTFCVLCDANVNYEVYMKPYENELDETILISNICANPKWTHTGNWKDKYFFVNMDVLNSEKEFMDISGCRNLIPAGTNVSNALVILLTQSDNTGRKNFFGYDKILLIGFDYCWKPRGKYYAFDGEGNGKNNYMRHTYALTHNRDFCYTSSNLLFSAKWLSDYVKAYQLPVVQCTKESIFATEAMGKLEEQMQYGFRKEDGKKVSDLVSLRKTLQKKMKELENQINIIAKEHYYSFVASV